MIADTLVKKFPFVANYFSLLFSSKVRKFPQSIVFEGLDVYAQCFFALELARVLNCLEDGKEDCQCLNCRWIREAKHPAVNFVSQIHYKTSDDESKTVISAIQAKNIEKSLRETSDYHRFFIFFDAQSTPLSSVQTDSLRKYSPNLYQICPNNDWSMRHINTKTFNPLTPNILLKCIEEPPERTTFVFLTKNRADLISTIVSRSQCFKLPANMEKIDIFEISKIFEKYPDITIHDAFLISENLQIYIKENELSADFVLDVVLAYLIKQLRFADDEAYIIKLQDDINNVAEARKYSSALVSEKNIFDTMLLKFAKRF